MADTRFTSLQVVGASSALATLAASVILYAAGDIQSTGTIFAPTLSGSTITANGGVYTINSAGLRSTSDLEVNTLSGSTLKEAGGVIVLNSAGLRTSGTLEVNTLSGASIRAAALSGATVFMNNAGGSGSAVCVKITGQLGTCGGSVGALGKCGPCN